MEISIDKDTSIKTQQDRVSISIKKGEVVDVIMEGKRVRIHHVDGVWTIDRPADVTSREMPFGGN